jgi:hypothetical protein
MASKAWAFRRGEVWRAAKASAPRSSPACTWALTTISKATALSSSPCIRASVSSAPLTSPACPWARTIAANPVSSWRRAFSTGFWFPRSAWERRLRRSAARGHEHFGIDPVSFGPQSGPVCVPTQSVGTRNEKKLEDCIKQCHKEALALIRDPKLRSQVAKLLSYSDANPNCASFSEVGTPCSSQPRAR